MDSTNGRFWLNWIGGACLLLGFLFWFAVEHCPAPRWDPPGGWCDLSVVSIGFRAAVVFAALGAVALYGSHHVKKHEILKAETELLKVDVEEDPQWWQEDTDK
jgi:hypothetical protein